MNHTPSWLVILVATIPSLAFITGSILMALDEKGLESVVFLLMAVCTLPRWR